MTPSLINRILPKLRQKEIIGDLEKSLLFTDEPKFSQWVCETLGREQNEGNNGVSVDRNDNKAKFKAIAESVERYALSNIDSQDLVFDTYSNLKDSALNPEIFINFDTFLFGLSKEEYVKKISNAPIQWNRAINLKDQKEILVPSQLVYSKYDMTKEPLIRFPISTGAAFGLEFSSTLIRGILEVVERDNFMRFWLTGKEVPQINIKKNLRSLTSYFERYLLEPYVLDISLDSEIPTMLGFLIDRTGKGPAVTAGLKSKDNEREAILGCLLEAQQVRSWIRFNYIRNKAPKIESNKLVTDFKSRGYYWFNLERINDIDHMFEYEHREINRQKILSYSEITFKIFSKGFDIYYIDITPRKIKDLGSLVIKAIIPQMHPLTFNENIPYNFSHSLGCVKSLNKLPHPFL